MKCPLIFHDTQDCELCDFTKTCEDKDNRLRKLNAR
jgi:hypothetical protein